MRKGYRCYGRIRKDQKSTDDIYSNQGFHRREGIRRGSDDSGLGARVSLSSGEASEGHTIIYSTPSCATGHTGDYCMGHSMNIKGLSIHI